jgi:hypothetical protein
VKAKAGRWLQRLADKVLADERAVAAFVGAGVPERVRIPLAEALRELVETELAEAEFWGRWRGLVESGDEGLAPIEDFLRTYLRLRRDPFASQVGIGGWVRPSPRFSMYERAVRYKAVRLSDPGAGLPLPGAAPRLESETLPVVGEQPGGRDAAAMREHERE